MHTAFTRLLLATEHSEFDSGAEAVAFALARRCGLALGGVLPLVSNAEFEAAAPQAAAAAEAEAAARRERLQARALHEGVTLQLQVRRGSEPFAEIVAEARARRTELLVIRRRGKRGLLAKLLVGEMVSKVVAHAPCSVVVAPQGAQLWSRRVLVGVDPQATDPATVALAAGVAAQCALPLLLLCVAAGEGQREAARRALDEALHRARELPVAAQGELRVGRVHEELLAGARAAGADLIVIARQGRRGRARIGSVAHQVLGLAECPVLIQVGADPAP